MRLTVSLISLVLFFACCKSDDDNSVPKCYDPRLPECENYDPCFFASEVTADFEIEAEIYSAGIWADSFVAGIDQFKRGKIRFRALEDDAQYKWVIGIETLYTQSVVRNFYNVQSGAIIPVQLEVNKAPNTTCYPFDDGKDKKDREFRLVTSGNDFHVVGSYKGKFKHSNDSSLLNIRVENSDLIIEEISGLDSNLLADPSTIKVYATDLLFVLDGTGNSTPKGDIKYYPNSNQLRMQYKHIHDPQGIEPDSIIFNGVKIE